MVTTRRGIPTRRAIAVAATASGGATTAPRASAAGQPIGSSQCATAPTASVVTMTSTTESSTIGRVLARKSMSEVRIAAA